MLFDLDMLLRSPDGAPERVLAKAGVECGVSLLVVRHLTAPATARVVHRVLLDGRTTRAALDGWLRVHLPGAAVVEVAGAAA